jgi:hypothetical protein
VLVLEHLDQGAWAPPLRAGSSNRHPIGGSRRLPNFWPGGRRHPPRRGLKSSVRSPLRRRIQVPGPARRRAWSASSPGAPWVGGPRHWVGSPIAGPWVPQNYRQQTAGIPATASSHHPRPPARAPGRPFPKAAAVKDGGFIMNSPSAVAAADPAAVGWCMGRHDALGPSYSQDLRRIGMIRGRFGVPGLGWYPGD